METILCPIDFSAGSINALLYANELAQHTNSRLQLVHVIYNSETIPAYQQVGSESNSLAAMKAEEITRQKLESLRLNLENTSWGIPVTYETSVLHLPQPSGLSGLIHATHTDLMVLGYNTGQNKSLHEKTVMAEAVKKLPCPVLIVPPKVTFRPFSKIVFATDLKGEPYADVQLVLKLAGMFEAKLIFLHVLTGAENEKRAVAEDELNRLAKRLPYKNFSVYLESFREIETGILQFSGNCNADLLVMGHHARPFWQQIFQPDYAEALAFHTTQPMLIFHY